MLLWFIGFLVLTYVVLTMSKTIKWAYNGAKETWKFISSFLRPELLNGVR